MVEWIKEHLAMLEAEKTEIETADTEALVKEAVEEYTVKIRAEIEAKRAEDIHLKSVEIEGVKRLLDRAELEEERRAAEKAELEAKALLDSDAEAEEGDEFELPEGITVENL